MNLLVYCPEIYLWRGVCTFKAAVLQRCGIRGAGRLRRRRCVGARHIARGARRDLQGGGLREDGQADGG